MHRTSRAARCVLLAIVGILGNAATVMAAPFPPSTSASNTDVPVIHVGKYWYLDDDYEYGDQYYPPPPPVRAYRYAPPPPVVVYEPPVYGWLAPPRPANCGQYRYWNGEYCADARYQPPYIGPRW